METRYRVPNFILLIENPPLAVKAPIGAAVQAVAAVTAASAAQHNNLACSLFEGSRALVKVFQ